MAVDDNFVSDLVSIDDANNVVLTISDHLDWTAKDEHLFLLQKKISTYFKYIETGQLYDEYPRARDRRPTIEIVFFHKPVTIAKLFLQRVTAMVAREGFSLHWTVYQHKETR